MGSQQLSAVKGRQETQQSNNTETDQPSQWVRGLGRQGGNRKSTDERLVQKEFSDYLSREGALRRQQDIAFENIYTMSVNERHAELFADDGY